LFDGGGCFCAMIGFSAQFQRQRHVFLCGEVAQQMELLKNNSHVSRAERRPCPFIQTRDILSGNREGSAVGSVESGQQSQ